MDSGSLTLTFGSKDSELFKNKIFLKKLLEEELFRKFINRFIKIKSGELKSFEYICILEADSIKRLHYHIIVNKDLFNYMEKINIIWNEVLNQFNKNLYVVKGEEGLKAWCK